MLTETEKKVISALQGNMPVCERPYQAMAQTLGMSEDEVIATARNLHERGVIRRFGATLKHQRSGYKANAMVAWKVDEQRVEEVGPAMAAFDEVTHCYRRNPTDTWPYNLYTMIHASDEASCHAIAHKISTTVEVTEYTLLFSRQELKKTSMRYFD
ncbi:MAG: Lrp/AsnC family transcriptional regulator [Desulfobacterium sp.]|jgi:DNA-binding Lrp family transcriptional regulator|nr:Lrp/AsnC family transcriptional regulator [Desulfobacterium sp.]